MFRKTLPIPMILRTGVLHFQVRFYKALLNRNGQQKTRPFRSHILGFNIHLNFLFALQEHVRCYKAMPGLLFRLFLFGECPTSAPAAARTEQSRARSNSQLSLWSCFRAEFREHLQICIVAIQTFLLACMPTGHLTKHCTSLI